MNHCHVRSRDVVFVHIKGAVNKLSFIFSVSLSLSDQGPARRPKPVEQGVIIFTN